MSPLPSQDCKAEEPTLVLQPRGPVTRACWDSAARAGAPPSEPPMGASRGCSQGCAQLSSFVYNATLSVAGPSAAFPRLWSRGHSSSHSCPAASLGWLRVEVSPAHIDGGPPHWGWACWTPRSSFWASTLI